MHEGDSVIPVVDYEHGLRSLVIHDWSGDGFHCYLHAADPRAERVIHSFRTLIRVFGHSFGLGYRSFRLESRLGYDGMVHWHYGFRMNNNEYFSSAASCWQGSIISQLL